MAQVVDNAYIGQRIEQMRDGVERGESMLRTAVAAGVFTPVVLQMIAVGEETGELDSLMREVADMYEREVEYEVKTLSQQIEPILIVVLGVLVLILALGVFLPIWDLGKAAIPSSAARHAPCIGRAASRTSGFSLLELVVSLTLIAVLVGVFLDRALYYRERAEKVGDGAGRARPALERESQGRRAGAGEPLRGTGRAVGAESDGPAGAKSRSNYLGVLDGAEVQEVVPGNWYFDSTSKEVVYYVDSGRYFAPDEQGRMRAAWRVKLVQESGGAAAPQWARLELVQPYRWF